MNPFPVIALPLMALIASCASDQGKSQTSSDSGHRSLSQRINEKSGFSQDKEGNWTANSNRRSSFETNRDNSQFQGDYQKKNFKTEKLPQKSWWGKTEQPRTAYQGNTDGNHLRSSSRLQGQGAREAGSSAEIPKNYATNDFSTGDAREASAGNIAHPTNAETEARRKVFTYPSVIDWREQRSMDIEQSRGILGR